MFGDLHESEDEDNFIRAPTPPADLVKRAEAQIARLLRSLKPVIQDERWTLPPEPKPREVPQRLFPQHREFKMVRALDDFSLPDPDLVRGGRALPALTRPELPSLQDVISRECSQLLASNPNVGFRSAFRSWALLPAQVTCLEQVFWWYVADMKRRDPAAAVIKDMVFLLFSDHFVEHVMTSHYVSATYRDQLQSNWTHLCAHVVYALCHQFFPNSAYRFNADFFQSIDATLRHWTTGHLPSELDRIRAALAEHVMAERGGADPAAAAEAAASSPRTHRDSALFDALHASAHGPVPRSAGGNLAGSTRFDPGTGTLGFAGLVDASKKAMFDPFQRSPALTYYLERHGAKRVEDGAALTSREEAAVRPRSHRRLGATLKGMRVGPQQDTIDHITFTSLAHRAMRSGDTSPTPMAVRTEPMPARSAERPRPPSTTAAAGAAPSSRLGTQNHSAAATNRSSTTRTARTDAPSEALVNSYQQTARLVQAEMLKERKRMNEQIRWLDKECTQARKSAARVARITGQMIGRIRMDLPDEPPEPPPPSTSPKSEGYSKGTSLQQRANHQEMAREAATREDTRYGTLLKSVVSRRGIRVSPSMAQISLEAVSDSGASTDASTTRRAPVDTSAGAGIDTDAVVKVEVRERQQLLRTLQDVQKKASEKQERARQTLRRILHEEEETAEGLEALVAEPIPWPKAKDSRDVEAQMKTAQMKTPPPRTTYDPPNAIRIQRGAQKVLRALAGEQAAVPVGLKLRT